MHKSLSLFFIALLSACTHTPSSGPTGNQGTLAEIRKLTNKIDTSDPTSTTEFKFDVENDPIEGSVTRNAYIGGLTMTEVSYTDGSNRASAQRFYYTKDGLIFVQVKDTTTYSGAPTDTNAMNSITETRYFFENDHCFHAQTRTARSANVVELAPLLATQALQRRSPGQSVNRLLNRAEAFRRIANSDEAVRFFASER